MRLFMGRGIAANDAPKVTRQIQFSQQHVGKFDRFIGHTRHWNVCCKPRVQCIAHAGIELSCAAIKLTIIFLERCDAFRKPARFAEILLACECDARGRLGFEERPYPQRARLAGALAAAQSVVTAEIAERAMAAGVTGQKVGELIHAARVAAVAAMAG